MKLSEYYFCVVADLETLGEKRKPFYWKVDEHLEFGHDPTECAEQLIERFGKNEKAWFKYVAPKPEDE